MANSSGYTDSVLDGLFDFLEKYEDHFGFGHKINDQNEKIIQGPKKSGSGIFAIIKKPSSSSWEDIPHLEYTL